VLLRKERTQTTKHIRKILCPGGERKAALAFLCTRAAPDYHLSSSKSDQNCWRCRFYGIRFAFPECARGRSCQNGEQKFTPIHKALDPKETKQTVFVLSLSHLWRINSLIYVLLLLSSYCRIQVDNFNLISSIMEIL